MNVLVFMSLVLAICGLFYLKDTRPDYRRGSRGTLAVGAISLSFLALMKFGVIAALLVLALFIVLAVWRLRS